MNSSFLLHGGSPFQNAFDFWRRLAGHDKRHINVLSIPFASFPAKHKLLAASRQGLHRLHRYRVNEAHQLGQLLSWVNPHKDFTITAASTNRNKLIRQIRDADSIFAGGGDGDNLQSYFEGIDLAPLVAEDKICGGNSAGANMWSTMYYSNDNQAVMQGLGAIPVASFCHFNSGKWRKLNILAEEAVNLELIPLTDAEYVEYQCD